MGARKYCSPSRTKQKESLNIVYLGHSPVKKLADSGFIIKKYKILTKKGRAKTCPARIKKKLRTSAELD